MNKIKIIILGGLVWIISIIIVSIIFKQIIIKKEKATPTEIENVTLYEKNQVLKLLKEEYPEDEFEIICYLSDINKSPSKWSPSSRKVGKKFMVRPNGQVGEEFLVEYYDDDKSKLFVTPIEPIIKSYYKDEETLETRRINSIIEEYMQPILDEFLEGKERFKDYNVYYTPITLSDLDWLKSIKNINDYFYMKSDNGWVKDMRYIYIYIYIPENDFNEEESYIYYNSFQKVANELFRKIDYEKSSNSNIEKYIISLNMYKLGKEDFNNIQSLDSQTLRILQLNKFIKSLKYKYRKEINIENGEAIVDYETSFQSFQET